MRCSIVRLCLALTSPFFICLFAPHCLGQSSKPATNAEASRYEFRREHDPDGIGKFYLGREIAEVMGHLAAGWLERPEREKEEEPTRLMDILKLKPDEIVADVGA